MSSEERHAFANVLADAINVTLRLMRGLGKEPAFNFTVNNVPGGSLYVEFLPYTQPRGGFERLGLWTCQNMPENAAADIREHFDSAGCTADNGNYRASVSAGSCLMEQPHVT